MKGETEMNKYLSITAAFVLLAWILPNSSQAREETKEVHNLSGEDAHDIKVVLEGHHTIDWDFKGFPHKWHFHGFQSWFEGDNTTLKWRHPRDGNNNPAPIPFCAKVHIGWGYEGEARHKILDMYWTDERQRDIHKSVVWNVTARKPYYSPEAAKLEFHNSIQPDDSLLIPYRSATISDIHYAYSDEQIDPDSLNLENEYLNDVLLQYLPGNYTIGPGDSVTVDLPLPENEDVWIIVRYNCNAPGLPGSEGDTDSTDCVDFVEWRSTANIPTLSEWGLIILALLLLAIGTVALVRRRKAILSRSV